MQVLTIFYSEGIVLLLTCWIHVTLDIKCSTKNNELSLKGDELIALKSVLLLWLYLCGMHWYICSFQPQHNLNPKQKV